MAFEWAMLLFYTSFHLEQNIFSKTDLFVQRLSPHWILYSRSQCQVMQTSWKASWASWATHTANSLASWPFLKKEMSGPGQNWGRLSDTCSLARQQKDRLLNNFCYSGPGVEQIVIQIPAWLVSSMVDCLPYIVEMAQQRNRLSFRQLLDWLSTSYYIDGLEVGQIFIKTIAWLVGSRIDWQPMIIEQYM